MLCTYLEQQEWDDRGGTRANASREIKGAKELRHVEEGRGKREDGEDVDLGDAQELGCMWYQCPSSWANCKLDFDSKYIAMLTNRARLRLRRVCSL